MLRFFGGDWSGGIFLGIIGRVPSTSYVMSENYTGWVHFECYLFEFSFQAVLLFYYISASYSNFIQVPFTDTLKPQTTAHC